MFLLVAQYQSYILKENTQVSNIDYENCIPKAIIKGEKFCYFYFFWNVVYNKIPSLVWSFCNDIWSMPLKITLFLSFLIKLLVTFPWKGTILLCLMAGNILYDSCFVSNQWTNESVYQWFIPLSVVLFWWCVEYIFNPIIIHKKYVIESSDAWCLSLYKIQYPF